MTTENGLEELAALHDSMREGVDLNDPSFFRCLVVLPAERHAVSPERLAVDLEPSRERYFYTTQTAQHRVRCGRCRRRPQFWRWNL